MLLLPRSRQGILLPAGTRDTPHIPQRKGTDSYKECCSLGGSYIQTRARLSQDRTDTCYKMIFQSYKTNTDLRKDANLCFLSDYFSNSASTVLSKSLIGRCCGQTLSQLPQPMQSEGLPPFSVWCLYRSAAIGSFHTFFTFIFEKSPGILIPAGQPSSTQVRL